MSYEKMCEICGKQFTNMSKIAKTCSSDCQRKRLRNMSGKEFLGEIQISPGTVGAIAEMIVSAQFLSNGYSVFRALSQSCFCDLIVIKGTTIKRVEVRTGYRYPSTGKLSFPKKTHGEIDLFAVYERNTGKVYLLDLQQNIVSF